MTAPSKLITTITLLEEGPEKFFARVLIDGVAFVSGPWASVEACIAHVGRIVSERLRQTNHHQMQSDPRAWVV